MRARRAADNPILTPASVEPSRGDFRVVGVFNPAAVIADGETCLLLRVAEAPRDVGADEVAAVNYDAARGVLDVQRWRRDTPGLDATDPRLVTIDGQSF